MALIYDVPIADRTNNGTLANYSGYDVKSGIPSAEMTGSLPSSVGSIKVYLKRTGSPTGNITAHISDGSGTVLYNSSDTLDVSTIDNSAYTEYTFNFSSAEITTGDIIYLQTDSTSNPNVNKIDYGINTPTGDLVRQLQGSSTWQTRTDRRWVAEVDASSSSSGGTRLPPPPAVVAACAGV